MAHFAKINENNIVENVIVVNNDVLKDKQFPESESIGISFCKYLYGKDTHWKQTSYTGSFRKKYAGEGYLYIENKDCFIEPQPYQSWNINEDCEWEAPVPYPSDGNYYEWDEENLSWILVEI